MKIREIIPESFNSQVSGEFIRSTKDLFSTRALINGRHIIFNAAAYRDGEKTIWEIEFVEKTANATTTYQKTGSRGEMQVFSFVIESIKELISRYDPDAIEFTSNKADRNRTKLYQHLAKRINLPGYSPAEIIPGTATATGDLFSIEREKS